METPETIYLIPDSEHGHLWCDDPAPGLGMDPKDAIEYRRADVVDATLAKQAKAARNGMDAARSASTQEMKEAQRLRDESKPELLESERQANAQLTAQLEYLEQLASDRLELVTATTDRALALETALAESTRILREILQGEKLQFSRRIQICSWADHLDALTNMEAPHG
ncbi:hypothetical protein [Marinobacter sp. Hex_13]|uniref:hypothetical protein n=1 Tax=Marinobacter sp. Hex_13 TaxID=1795866 RepID=UPI0007940CAE|nr:hypothetical protein [Marinobacter sp. Hex_13]KXJ45840.1 MAG: hypothetical protein AXW11_12165 [Marinobacter sp. Hex_13]